jgi:hypothetical protein
VVLGAGVVDGQAARLELLLPLGVVGGQVGGDLLPRLALVPRAEEELGADVERARLVGAQVDGRVPVVAVLGLAFSRQRLDVAVLPGGQAHARDLAALVLDVDHVGI